MKGGHLMPELPEMETYRQLLGRQLTGLMITEAEINREKSINVPPAEFTRQVQNSTITSIDRRAKHLIFRLSSGKNLLLHLMLGGWMYLGNDEDNPDRTKQVILSFGSRKLYFIGLRLGYLHLLSAEELEKDFEELGPEPLDPGFTAASFAQLLEKKRGMLKTSLVNQHFIAGIGNCYSDEICHQAGLLPMRKIEELSEMEKSRLYSAIKTVFANAIQSGGYMDEPLFKGDLITGGYNERCMVYDRKGESCLRCGSQIVKEEISSRKTFYCPGCQS